ncbi:MAG: hypothetical protein LBH45_02015 [Campylobacteraceae bacterium]|nr:hypothetical protein [Campylobacteraceae bacterium]
MALKDDIKAIKEELSAQEQLLENIIAGERFFKKHKRTFVALVIAVVVLLIGYISLNTIKAVNLKASNEAYKTLLDNPNDEKALSSLKSKNKPLYRTFVFMEALKNDDNETLKTLLSEKDIIADLAAYQIQEDMKDNLIFEDFITLKDGYKLLKEGKTDEASMKFMTISPDSSIMSIVNSLEHYQPSLKEVK